MNVLKAEIEKEKEEKRTNVGKGKTPVKAGNRKVVPSYSSSRSTSPTSSEGKQPTEKTKATERGKHSTQKAPAKVSADTPLAAKLKGNRALEEPTPVAMPPPTSTSTVRVTRLAARTPGSTSSTSVSFTASISASVPTRKAPPGEVSSASEPDLPNDISMAELSQMATKPYPNVRSVMNIPMLQKIRMVLRQGFLDGLSVSYQFGKVDPVSV